MKYAYIKDIVVNVLEGLKVIIKWGYCTAQCHGRLWFAKKWKYCNYHCLWKFWFAKRKKRVLHLLFSLQLLYFEQGKTTTKICAIWQRVELILICYLWSLQQWYKLQDDHYTITCTHKIYKWKGTTWGAHLKRCYAIPQWKDLSNNHMGTWNEKNVRVKNKSSPRIGLCWSSPQYKKLHVNNTIVCTHKKIKQKGEKLTRP